MTPHVPNFPLSTPAYTAQPSQFVATNKQNDIQFLALSYESMQSGPPPRIQKITSSKTVFRLLDGILLFSLLIALTLNIVIWGNCLTMHTSIPNIKQPCILHYKIGGLRPILSVRVYTPKHPSHAPRKSKRKKTPKLTISKLLLTTLIYTWTCQKTKNRYLNCNIFLWPLYTLSVILPDSLLLILFRDWERIPKMKDIMIATVVFEGIVA